MNFKYYFVHIDYTKIDKPSGHDMSILRVFEDGTGEMIARCHNSDPACLRKYNSNLSGPADMTHGAVGTWLNSAHIVKKEEISEGDVFVYLL